MIEILKALHIAAIAGWSAGLLCLPSLYVQRCHVGSRDELHRLQALVRFAYINLVSPLAFVAVASGTALIFARSVVAPWFALKLALVLGMSFLHVLTGLVVIRLFREGERYPTWRFVLATLVAAALVLGILWLVLAKPALPPAPAAFFRPGALQNLLAPLNPWATP
ncbi:hypothetical protein A6J80_01845 (plasmid) [Paracoccus yeei]|uniref:Protoporphyrinogen IX oxidase n=1 Tax=Paracoccus yeei TaxID=147645 RepID=A0A1V0GN40_9RHOB|nr:CopD family protein [Paracoccus yeei]ARC35276.1 hypothetical protein A6J80_01845 [Paracoccus yeei]